MMWLVWLLFVPSSGLLSSLPTSRKLSSILPVFATSAIGPKSNKIQKQVVKLPDLSQAAFPDIPENGYDLVVIGSGPGGEAAAVYAAKLGKRVAVIEKKAAFGGPTGLTSKAIREAAKRICKAVDQVGGDRRKQVRGLWKRGFSVLKTEAEVLQAVETRDRLKQSGCDLFIGAAKFMTTGEGLAVQVCRSNECVPVTGTHVCIATGSRPYRPSELRPGVPLPFTKGRVVCATEIGGISELPNAIVIVGGGVIAVEYATVFAELGVGVTLLCREDQFLSFLELELRRTLRTMMARSRILFVGEDVSSVKVEEDYVKVALVPNPRRPQVERVFKVDMMLYSGGRVANSNELACAAAGVEVGKYDRIKVNSHCRTTSDHSVFAIGDVIGPPGLASSAQQQGRALVDSLFHSAIDFNDDEPGETLADSDTDSDADVSEVDPFFSSADAETVPAKNLFGSLSGSSEVIDAPLTLWTIPEIASVGLSREDALKKGMSNIVEGRAYFKDMARGRLSGGEGFLKVVARFDGKGRHTIIGVHIIGEGANELIQLGSILLHSKSTMEQVSRTPFAAVTLSGLYQMACDNALFSPGCKLT